MKHISRVLLIIWCIGGAYLLSGCGNGGTPTIISSTSTTTTTVSTRVVAPATTGARVAGRTVFAPVAVTGAVVQIITADGTTYTMTDDGNGVYTASVSGLSGNFVIEARKGELVMENMFTGIASGLSTIDAGETNATTTAYVEIAKTMLTALNVSGVDTSNNLNLLQSLENAQVNIDLIELREDVVDAENTQYSQVITTYSTVLAAADQSGTGDTDCLEVFAQNPDYQTTVTTINTFTPPTTSDDKTDIRNAINSIYEAYFGQDTATLLSYMSSDFIEDGYPSTHAITQWQTEWAECTSSTGSILGVTFDSLTDTTAQVTIKDNWAETCSGHSTASTEKWQAYFTKENGVWKWQGNQAKVNYWWYISKETSLGQYGSTNYYLQIGFEETSSYPVSSATVSGSKLSNTITLTKETDSSRWLNSGQSNALTAAVALDDTFILSVTFTDGTIEQYTFVVKQVPPNVTASITTNPAIDTTTGYLNIEQGTSTVPMSFTITGDTSTLGSWSGGIWYNSFEYRTYEQPIGGAYSVSIPTAGMPIGTYMHTRLELEGIWEHARTVYTWTTIYGSTSTASN